MADAHSVGYEQGHRQAWLSLLMQALGNLGYPPATAPDRVAERARWVLERERAVLVLRQVCAAHGDNDWATDLSLADVIEKHLWNHLALAPPPPPPPEPEKPPWGSSQWIAETILRGAAERERRTPQAVAEGQPKHVGKLDSEDPADG